MIISHCKTNTITKIIASTFRLTHKNYSLNFRMMQNFGAWNREVIKQKLDEEIEET